MQGIVSILRSDTSEKPTSIHRTVSADMSTKSWSADNGLPLLNQKIGFSDEEECVTTENEEQNPRRVDIWTVIMSQKKDHDSGKLPPPYVHPLVKKSSSSLSEKSLKICTESLGSETGSETASDAFSLPSFEEDSETSSDENDMLPQKTHPIATKNVTAKSVEYCTTRSLPPPLPSLAAAHADRPSVHVHSRRIDGRLVLEAVSVPQQKYFEAKRQDGRFLLTLISDTKHESPAKVDQDEDRMKTDSGDKDVRMSNNGPPNLTRRVMNVHKLKRIMERDNENPMWSRKLNTKQVKIGKLVLPRSRTTGLLPATSATTAVDVIDPLITQHWLPTEMEDLVVFRDNEGGDRVFPSLKGCKEPRRSHLMWEPFCIATS